MTGGEVHYGYSPWWNEMGPVTTGVMWFKRAAQWQAWNFDPNLDQGGVQDIVNCPEGGGHYNTYAASEGRNVWGCLNP